MTNALGRTREGATKIRVPAVRSLSSASGIWSRFTTINQKQKFITQCTLLGFLLLAGFVRILFAQGLSGSSHHPSYDIKTHTPLTLPEAYSLAIGYIGQATNRVHCVSASCLETDSERSTGWVLTFSNKNGARAAVKVFFNKDVWVDPQTSSFFK
jgi:hypothetical protein